MSNRRRGAWTALAMLMVAAIAFPLGVVASHQFSDVPTTNTFHGDIAALVDAGITAGCGSGKYCPSDPVTRGQMAAFLNRLGALAPGKLPKVNANRLDGLDSTDFLQSGDASRLVRDVIDVGVDLGVPLRSLSLEQLPNLAALLGPDPNLETISTFNVVLQPQASVIDGGQPFRGLSVWLGEPSMPGASVIWPIRFWYTPTDAEYTRPSGSSSEILHLVVVSSVTN